VSLDPQLLEILACPDTHHAPLIYDDPAQTLTCTECGRIFEIRDGIPVLLLDEAREGGAREGGTAPGTAGENAAEAGVGEQ
jgi:uncharacterized protein YbaR (Trm112 family)